MTTSAAGDFQRLPRLRVLALGSVLAAALGACTSNRNAGAAVNAGAAAVIYAATGCKYAGCPHGSTCDARSGLCESLPCGEIGCSGSEECDDVHHTCVPRGSLAPLPVTTVSPTSPTSTPGGP